jgi:hypothetical protein
LKDEKYFTSGIHEPEETDVASFVSPDLRVVFLLRCNFGESGSFHHRSCECVHIDLFSAGGIRFFWEHSFFKGEFRSDTAGNHADNHSQVHSILIPVSSRSHDTIPYT